MFIQGDNLENEQSCLIKIKIIFYTNSVILINIRNNKKQEFGNISQLSTDILKYFHIFLLVG